MNIPQRPRSGWVWAVIASLVLAASGFHGLWAADVKIEFIPPPMEGTISLGIYDSAGKLIRVLRKEADTDQFTVALNGLIAHWDGADNAGAPCVPGKYHARGWMVGELDIDGVDFIGNDWVTEDESPRVCRITALAVTPSGIPLVQAIGPGQNQPQVYSIEYTAPESSADAPEIGLVADPNSAAAFPSPSPTDGDARLAEASVKPSVANAASATPSAHGFNGAVWTIDGTSIKKVSATGELLLTVPTRPTDPVPRKLAASPVADRVYVLSENSAVQRVIAFDCTGLAPGVAPKVLFAADIRFSDRYEQVASLLTFPNGKPFVPATVLPVTLVPNPLLDDKPGVVRLNVAVDASGAFLTAADGLPLAQISETPHLRWAVMGRPPGSKAVTVFESDGAAVGEFKATRLANMMEFDAGEVELK